MCAFKSPETSPLIRVNRAHLEASLAFPKALREVMLRLAWANMQVVTVENWEMAFLFGGATEQLAVKTESHPPTYVVCRETIFDPPPEIGLLAADAIHSMRAVLDYLAVQLVAASGNQVKKGQGGTQFPIRLERQSNGLKVAGGVSEDILRAIDSLQPYVDDVPTRNPLAVLNFLANQDKHQLLNLSVMRINYGVTGIRFKDGQILNVASQECSAGLLETEVLRVPTTELREVDSVIGPQRSGCVTWSAPPPGWPERPVSGTLITIYEHMLSTVLPALKGFLPRA